MSGSRDEVESDHRAIGDRRCSRDAELWGDWRSGMNRECRIHEAEQKSRFELARLGGTVTVLESVLRLFLSLSFTPAPSQQAISHRPFHSRVRHAHHHRPLDGGARATPAIAPSPSPLKCAVTPDTLRAFISALEGSLLTPTPESPALTAEFGFRRPPALAPFPEAVDLAARARIQGSRTCPPGKPPASPPLKFASPHSRVPSPTPRAPQFESRILP
jgi:hypothetical protein